MRTSQSARALRAAVVGAIVIALVLLAGCADETTNQASKTASPPAASGQPPLIPSPLPTGSAQTSLPKCDYPPRIPTPSWFPEDLPLPEGTYASQDLGGSGGFQRAMFVVKTDLADLARFVLTRWPDAGWTIGRGESEAHEIEDDFSKVPAAGQFKAQSIACDPGYVLMVIVYSPNALASPTPSG